MSTPILLPSGISMFQRGHILTLSGLWDHDLMDEFEHGLNGVRLVLPRTQSQKFVTLHLFNFSIEAGAVDMALSLVRRTFSDHATEVTVVAEGTLGEAGLLFVVGSQRGYRKLFEDAEIQCRLNRPGQHRPLGFASRSPAEERIYPRSLGMLPAPWQTRLVQEETVSCQPRELLGIGVVDKVIGRG